MTWALVAVIVVLVVALVVVIRHDRSATAAVAAGEGRAADAQRKADDAARRADDAATQATAAEARARAEGERARSADDRATAADARLALERQNPRVVATPAGQAALAHVESLWGLALLEADRAWRLTMALPQSGDGDHHTGSLADALEGEISRIREETGTPGNLQVALLRQPDPGQCLMALRTVQGLLAALSRHSQGFDVYLGDETGTLEATVVCEEFDGPDTVADEAAALLEALSPARGVIDIDRSAEGRLRARFTLPAK